MAYAMTVSFPIQWGDMDALGHVNNAVYFRWFESARIAMFDRLGVRPQHGGPVGPILATTTCDYLVPLVYPGEVTIGVSVTKVGTTSLTLEYGLWRDGDADRLCARASSVIVLVEYATGRKVPISAEVRERIAAL